MNQPRLVLVAALLLSVAVFVPALQFSFVHDDVPQIVDNPAVRSWSELPKAFTHHLWARGGESFGNYYRPVFHCWLLLGYSLFGLAPWGWHLATILLHTLVAALVYLVAVRLLGNKMTAAVSALLFAVHPIHIENVAWISGGVDSLLAVFLLSSFLAFLKSREQASGKWRWLLTSLLIFCCGLLTKETAIVFPVIVVLYIAIVQSCSRAREAHVSGHEFTRAEKQKVGLGFSPGSGGCSITSLAAMLSFFLLDAFYLLLRWHVLGAFEYPRTLVATSTLLFTVPWALCWYLWHQIAPVGLSLFYDQHYVAGVVSLAFVLPVVLLLAAKIVFFRLRRRSPAAAVLLCWFFIFLLPCLNLRAYQVGEVAHDRYLYLPSVAFCLLMAMLLRVVARRSAILHAGLATALVCLLAAGTLMQETYYRDNYMLAIRGVTIAPKNTAALLLFARELTARNRAEDSLAAYGRLTREVPSWWTAWYERGSAALRFQHPPEADEAFTHSSAIDPHEPSQYYLRAVAESHMGNAEGARATLQQGIANAGDAPILQQGLDEFQKTGSVGSAMR